jgi:hypothetical protein
VPADVNRHVLSALVSLEEELPAMHRRSPAELARLGFLEYLDGRPRRKGRSDQSAVLIFDQFEEILSTAPRALEARRAFFSAVGAALDTGRYWALFVIREDYLAALAPYRDLIPTQLTNTYRLDLLGLEGAREAASKLAEEGGRSFPAVDRLVRDLSVVHVQQPDGSFVAEQGIHVEPVYLQVVCRRLWAALPEDATTIDEAAVAAYAQVSKSLAGYYADAVAAIAGDDVAVERALRDWVGTRLIVGGIRSQVRQQTGVDGDTSLVHIHKLLDSYLIRSEQRAGANWYELSHDRLVEPVLQDNEAWQQAHLHPLQVQAKLWEAGGRAQALLLGSDGLPGANAWAAANPQLLTAGEREFLRLSQDRRDRQVRRRRGRRIFTAALAAVAAVAIVSAVLASEARRESDEQRSKLVTDPRHRRDAQGQGRGGPAAAEAAQDVAVTAGAQADQARTQAEKSQKDNERSVRQMFEVALRPVTERLISQRQIVGVVEVGERWTPLLARGDRTLVAASLGENFRVVVAGHEWVLNEANTDGRSLFLEITAQWLLADQARRRVAIVTQRAERDRRIEVLRRNLLRLAYQVELRASIADDEALAEVGMLILDNRMAPAFSADEVATLEAFVKRGGGVLAVGRGRSWLEGRILAAPTLDDYPMNVALAAVGARWSDADVGPQELAQRDEAAIVRFESKLVVEVNLYTRSAGREEYYTTLAGGEARELLTVIGREWVFRATADGRALGKVVIADESQTVSIGATAAQTRVKIGKRPEPSPTDPDGKDPAQLRENLSDADMQAGLGRAEMAAKACGKRLKTLMSEAIVQVKVGGDGKVESVEVQRPARWSPEAICIATEVAKLSFARTREGGEATWKLRLY